MGPENPPRRSKSDQEPVTIDLEANAAPEDDTKTVDAASDTAAKVLPVAAAVGAGLAALWLVRKRTAPRTFAAYRPPETTAHRRRVRWAQLAGILGSAIRIGTSPQARSLWHNLRARRRRRY